MSVSDDYANALAAAQLGGQPGGNTLTPAQWADWARIDPARAATAKAKPAPPPPKDWADWQSRLSGGGQTPSGPLALGDPNAPGPQIGGQPAPMAGGIGQELPNQGGNKPGGPTIAGRQLPDTAPNPTTAPGTTYANPPGSTPFADSPLAQAPPPAAPLPPPTEPAAAPIEQQGQAPEGSTEQGKWKLKDPRMVQAQAAQGDLNPMLQGLRSAAPQIVY